MDALRTVSLLLAALSIGLMAGLFFAFTFSVMPALRRADTRTLVVTMQKVNTAIQNPWFFLIFFGGLLFTAVALALQIGRDPLIWVALALAFYLATLAVTIAGNIPLNTMLDAVGDPDLADDLDSVRERYELPWTRLNAWRTATNVVSFGFIAWALVVHGQG